MSSTYLACLGFFFGVAAAKGQAALTHAYEFQNSLADSLGGPSLSSNGGTLNAGSYVFAAGQGLSLSSALTDSGNYSILIDFSFSALSGYRKIIDFDALSTDAGFYNLNNALNFYPVVTGPSTFLPNVETRLVLTRDGSSGEVDGYVNGVQQWSFVDTSNLAVFSAANNVINFFDDDVVTSQREQSGGTVTQIGIYDAPLTANQVAALAGPGTSGVAPGPGDVQLSAATATVTEAAGSVTLSVSRILGSSGAVSVSYATADDTALAGTDYQAVSGTLSWADGDATPKTITVPITNRNLTAGSTMFLVNLSNPAGGAALGSPTQEAVTVLDTLSTADIQSVTLLSPPAGIMLAPDLPVVLQADVEALSGTLANVEFFAVGSSGNSTDLGGTASPRGQVTWTPTTADTYTLQVVATDSGGNTQQATSTVTVAEEGGTAAQTTLEAGIDGITVPLNTTLSVVAQGVDSAGNALQNVQFYLDGVPQATAPVTAMRRAGTKAADTVALTLYQASVVASKIQQVMTVVGTTTGGVSSVSTAATIYGKADAATPPTASISSLASGASVPTSAGQSVSVSATSGSQAIAKVQLVVDNQSVGVATAAPFNFNLPALAAGSHALSVIATDVGNLSSVSAPVYITAAQTATQTAAFFNGEVALANGVYYLSFPSGNYFGYYSFLANPSYLFHFDLGFEYIFDAADGKAGVYLYDFASGTFFYTSPSFPFPYLYDFTLNSVLYYYPDPNNAGHYNTDGIRYFYDFNTGTIITK